MLVIVAITKTLEGAWIVLVLIPAIVAVFKATKTHYSHVAAQLTLRGYTPQRRVHNTVLVPSAACSARSWKRCGTASRCPTMSGLFMWPSTRRALDRFERVGHVGRPGTARDPGVAVSDR